MVKFYKIRKIEIDEQKIKNHRPIQINVQTEYGHESKLELILMSFKKTDNKIHLSFEFPLGHPLHNHTYIFGYYDLQLDKGKLRIYYK